MHKIIASVVLLCCSRIIFGQPKDLEFQHISIKEGLSQSTIHCILQDKTGLMWIGTGNGLNRFDGYDFTNFTHNRNDTNSISSNAINTIYQDRSGLIWVGTEDGLNIIESNKKLPQGDLKFFKFDDSILSSSFVEVIFQDKNGYIWVGTSKGLNKILFSKHNLHNLTFEHFFHKNDVNSLSSSYIKDIIEDSSGNLWIGTLGGGLNKYDRKKNKFFHFKHDPSDPGSISSNFVLNLFIDHLGGLWIGTYDGGLNKFDPLSKKFISYKNDPSNPKSISDNHVYSIQEDLNGNLWLATFGGISVFDPDTNQFFTYENAINDPQSLSSNFVRCLFIDKSENLWAGTNNGINKTDLKPPKFLTFKRSPNKLPTFSSGYTLSLYEDNSGILWIGTVKGLDKYNIKTGEITNFKILHNQTKSKEGFIYSIKPGEKNILWLGSFGGGLYKFNTKTNSLRQFRYDSNDSTSIIDSRITTLFTDHKGNLLLGTIKGICIFDKDEEKVLQRSFESLTNIYISAIYQDKNRNYWIGTYKGLYLFDENKKFKTKYESDPNKVKTISSNIVYSICEDKKGNIWIGTDSGLDRINIINGKMDHFFQKHGLPSNSIASIINDNEGNLWISTFKGISKFSPSSDKIVFQNYGLADGTASLEFTIGAVFKNKKGEIYFGSLNGFNKFDPAEIYNNPYLPKIIITKFYKFNKLEKSYSELKNLNSISLAYDERFFSFEFASLDFTNPSKNKYAYKLEGFDNDWIYTERRYANYTNIETGEYIFKVIGTNNDGIWSEIPAQIVIFINPPFWQTWWFRIAALFLIMGGAAFIYQRRIKKLENEKKINEEFSRKLIQSQEEERKRIASELHDGLGQDLLIIKNLALLGFKKDEKEFSIKQLKEISSVSSSAIEEVRQIAYNLHPYQLDRLGLTKAIKSIITQAGDLTNINFTELLHDIDNLFSKENEINIYRIIQECINNIIKHSGAAEAGINIFIEDDKLIIKIFDNGKGFNMEKLSHNSKGFGMSSISKRVNILKGELNIKSDSNGTNITIKIPIKNNE